jgi:hypothetical protein
MPIISAIREVEIRSNTVGGQPGQKLVKVSPQPIKKLGVVIHVCPSSYLGSVHGRITVQVHLGTNVKILFKNNQRKKG